MHENPIALLERMKCSGKKRKTKENFYFANVLTDFCSACAHFNRMIFDKIILNHLICQKKKIKFSLKLFTLISLMDLSSKKQCQHRYRRQYETNTT